MKIDFDKSIELYIKTPNSFDFYKKAFRKYDLNGINNFTWMWSWWAFVGGAFYLLYRKVYLGSFLYILTFILLKNTPLISLTVWIISGGVLPYLVFRRYKRVINEIEEKIENIEEQTSTLKKLGGVNRWAIWLAILLNTVLVFSIFIISINHI